MKTFYLRLSDKNAKKLAKAAQAWGAASPRKHLARLVSAKLKVAVH